jgi:hypothetical protein
MRHSALRLGHLGIVKAESGAYHRLELEQQRKNRQEAHDPDDTLPY